MFDFFILRTLGEMEWRHEILIFLFYRGSCFQKYSDPNSVVSNDADMERSVPQIVHAVQIWYLLYLIFYNAGHLYGIMWSFLIVCILVNGILESFLSINIGKYIISLCLLLML